MKSLGFGFGLVLFVLFGCNNDSDRTLIHISKESIIHDNSSKVWVIAKVLDKGVNVSQPKFNKKDVAIFFKSGKVYFQPISSLGNFPDRGGFMELSENSEELFLNFSDEKWHFQVEEVNTSCIKLKYKKGSDFKYDLVLIAYPEGS